MFYSVYFIYYGAYALFSSYIISYLTTCGLSATVCGIVTSFMLLTNIIMQPVSGFLTDSFLTVKRYLIFASGFLVIWYAFIHIVRSKIILCVIMIVVSAGFSYPFIQLMDAWVTDAAEQINAGIVYSKIRAIGSIGFAIISWVAGYYFENNGYEFYFLIQAALFILIIPFLKCLPEIVPGNKKNTSEKIFQSQLTMQESFKILFRNVRFKLCTFLFILYWMSHRPIGSFLALFCRQYDNGDILFGHVCASGAIGEFLMLFCAERIRQMTSLRTECTLALLLNLFRPVMIMVFPSEGSLYFGQILQSFSFAMYFDVSVELFSLYADKRLHNFTVSMGLMVSNVIGTLSANILGGKLYDLFGVKGNLWLSFVGSILLIILYILVYSHLFMIKKTEG